MTAARDAVREVAERAANRISFGRVDDDRHHAATEAKACAGFVCSGYDMDGAKSATPDHGSHDGMPDWTQCRCRCGLPFSDPCHHPQQPLRETGRPEEYKNLWNLIADCEAALGQAAYCDEGLDGTEADELRVRLSRVLERLPLPSAPASQPLFRIGQFVLHSGDASRWKIDCDAFGDEDIAALALIASRMLPPFGSVYGIQTGGERLARELWRYAKAGSPRLVVDDVLTTGASVRETMAADDIGFVIFARGPLPPNVVALFTVASQPASGEQGDVSDDKFPGFAFGLRDTRDQAKERKVAKRAEREDPKHLALVRKKPCMIAGKHRCRGRVQAHHEPAIGKRTDWHDHKTVPLCDLAHKERHTIGKARFERRHGVSFEKALLAHSGVR